MCICSRPASYPGGISLQQGKNENSAKEFVYLSPRPAARHISLPSSLASDSFRPRGKHVPRKKEHPEREKGIQRKTRGNPGKEKSPIKEKPPFPAHLETGASRTFSGSGKAEVPLFPLQAMQNDITWWKSSGRQSCNNSSQE